MKFRFYIINDNNGSVRGTNDKEVALDFSEVDGMIVIDAETGQFLDGEIDIRDIDQ